MSKSSFKKCIVLYVEGQTEEEFYKKVKEYMKKKLPIFKVDQFKVVCIESNTKFKNKLLSKFKNEIIAKYNKQDEIVVVLAYDSDGYEFGKHPVVNRKKIESELLNIGATRVIHLVAEETIEDFIMLDKKGVLKFLGLSPKTVIKGKTGLEQLQYLFKKCNKTYFKGHKVEGLLDHLDFNLICSKLCLKLSLLCCEVGIECPKDIMKS